MPYVSGNNSWTTMFTKSIIEKKKNCVVNEEWIIICGKKNKLKWVRIKHLDTYVANCLNMLWISLKKQERRNEESCLFPFHWSNFFSLLVLVEKRYIIIFVTI